MKRCRRLSKQLGDLENSTGLCFPLLDDALFSKMNLNAASGNDDHDDDDDHHHHHHQHDDDMSRFRKRAAEDVVTSSSGDDDTGDAYDTAGTDNDSDADEWRVGELPAAAPHRQGRPMPPPLLRCSSSFKENEDSDGPKAHSLALSPSPSPRRTLTVSKRRILVATKFSYEHRLPLDKVFLASVGSGLLPTEAAVNFVIEEEDTARDTVKLALSA
jgi:hypothetical protein